VGVGGGIKMLIYYILQDLTTIIKIFNNILIFKIFILKGLYLEENMSIEPKTIGQLKDYHFFVPSYQRGYRWTENEAVALLDDVSEFPTEGGKRYCIQPLIVKRRDDDSFEVVDGQQRLTTIFIFMKIVEETTKYFPFELEYETRGKNKDFLSTLSPKGDIIKDDINIFHITTVREAINNWLDNPKKNPDGKSNIRFNAITKLFIKLTESVFFIWYEIPSDSDPNILFTKVNMWKIQLTNAELIKALILNKENFNKDINKRQIEISVAWDRIEQGLHDDSFWYFLNEKEQSGTRIDMLFDLLANEYNTKLSDSISVKENYFPFLVFLAVLKSEPDKDKFVEKLWNDVEELYAEFRGWYADLDKYHIIGYLISSGVTMDEIFKLTRGGRKHKIIKELIKKAEGITPKKYLDLSYDNSSDRKKIQQLLLLFNIASLVCKSEKQYRFPFDIYKGEAKSNLKLLEEETEDKLKWSIEHIHATADETDDADDSIGNLTLLDTKTNSSYKDAPFDVKRKVIIERESKGLFIPLCTKNVFLKVYSKKTENINMNMWDDEDKKDYTDEIEQMLKLFFEMGL